jgi:hypothetical protein
MKRVFLFVSVAFIITIVGRAQEETKEEFKPSGKVFAKVFFNYHRDMTEGTTQKNTFELQRAYLGYKYNFSKDISFKLTIDAGRQIKDVDGELLSPYTATLKTAQIDWKVAEPVKLSIGLIGLKQFNTQENFWGYRYIFKSFQDEFALGSSADLGINAEVKLAENLKSNLFVLNGEGYSKIQDPNGRMKVGGNLIFEPIEGLTLKGYFDIYGGNILNDSSVIVEDTTFIQSIAFFAGYKTDKFRVGAEYNLQKNGKKYYQIAADHDITGVAVYGTYVINKKFEAFAEWLQFKSNTLEGETVSWNNKKDGNIIVTGVQFMPVKGVKMALNYRSMIYDNSAFKTKNYIYANFEFAF